MAFKTVTTNAKPRWECRFFRMYVSYSNFMANKWNKGPTDMVFVSIDLQLIYFQVFSAVDLFIMTIEIQDGDKKLGERFAVRASL